MRVEFLVPRTVEEAVAVLGDDDALPIGGGIAVALLSNLDLVWASRLVSLGRIPELRGVRVRDDNIVLGATTPHGVIAADPVLRAELPELAAMFGHIGNVRVRAWGTVGGNLALAEPSQDPPVLLAALGAELLTMGPAGIRRLPVAELSEGPMTTVLATGKLITHVVVPRLGSDERCAYLKFLPKTADDYATVSAGVRLRLDGQTIIEARIFCGSVGPIPVDCAAAAELLVGRSSDDENVLAGLAEAVAEVVTPRSDHRGVRSTSGRWPGCSYGGPSDGRCGGADAGGRCGQREPGRLSDRVTADETPLEVRDPAPRLIPNCVPQIDTRAANGD